MESGIETVPNFICAFPVSSQYGPGSRLMYYVLVIASVFARKQVWVRKVCLVAALLFPAIAAIHGIALAVLHDDGVIDMDVFGAFQICAIGILAAPVTVRLSLSYFTRNIIFFWTFLILAGLVSLTLEFYHSTRLTPDWPFTTDVLDNKITPSDGEAPSDPFHSVQCSLIGRKSSSPLRANNIYVVAAPPRLTFETATLLAASCCIPAVLSLLFMWNKILELTFTRRFRMEEGRRWGHEPFESTNDPLIAVVALVKTLNCYVKILLDIVEIPVFYGAIFLILFMGERNFFSPQVSYQTVSRQNESESSAGAWAPAIGVSLAATLGSLYLLRDANPGPEKNETNPNTLSKATADSAHENRRETHD